MTQTDTGPRVRVVVANYNGGDLVTRSVEHLLATDWPPSALDVVVVDNASRDGSADRIARLHPEVTVVSSPDNLGFAGGSNMGMVDLEGVDYVALVNNDAFVDPNWLKPLVAALEQDPHAGAACPKIVFEPRFVELRITTEGFIPGPEDPRLLGVSVSGVRSDGEDRWDWAYFVDGFHVAENPPPEAEHEPQYRWSFRSARLWVPLPRRGGPVKVELRLATERAKDVTIRVGDRDFTFRADVAPAWYELELDGPFFDVVNNAGCVLLPDGSGADRGYWEADGELFEQHAEVFAWCGAAVLLSARYLREVGILDGRYFMYYEDFDLSWRGRSRGWRYVYVPDSKVVHVHAASAVEGSALFDHFVQRNRLLTLVKNAPAGLALRQATRFAGEVTTTIREEVVRPVLRREEVELTPAGQRRLRAGGAFLKHLPIAMADRWRNAARRSVPHGELLRWSVGQRAGGREQ